jgi:hypothetical protein
MTNLEFWNLIQESRLNSTNTTEQLENLKNLLIKNGTAITAAFHTNLCTTASTAYKWELWAIAYIINHGCSDDGFDYFIEWAILQGKDFFEALVKFPEDTALTIPLGTETECEGIYYAAEEAYEELGEDSDYLYQLQSIEKGIEGEPWHESEVYKLFPRLAAKYTRPA